MRSKRKKYAASMTVETSIALPLFIFFFVNIMTLFNIVKVQCDMEAALHQTGSKLSLNAFYLRLGEDAVLGQGNEAIEAIAGGVGVLQAKNEVLSYLGSGIDRSCVTGGRGGISFLHVYKLVSLYMNTFRVVHHTGVKFDKIAGMNNVKRDMSLVVNFLKDPKAAAQKGIRPIKGVILEGPPGNGKTLFARALAEECKVNFIATKGADFQSALMSMGAMKIKLLFSKARRSRPCIVFIDEFDSIGERRNYAGTGIDKENNRIITTMLNEMDGFNPSSGILVIGATNSYQSLDPALIRAGRFDLKYHIGNPDADTRKELIRLYTAGKTLSADLVEGRLSDMFKDLSCAEIETILNEAASVSLAKNAQEITISDIAAASEKIGVKINVHK